MTRLSIGTFVVPDASDPQATVERIVAAEKAGLDLVGVQDHPYQRRFLDTWTLLSYAAARTERIRLVPDVINLQLRQAAVLAKAAASLDLLSGGRVELGIGAGGFPDAVAAVGGPGLSGKESVDAMVEAIEVMRAFWSGERSITAGGEYHHVTGAKPGPPPAHPIGLWIGAYGPRMIRITGRLGDGWLPSYGYLSEEDIARRQAEIDEAARAAGRDPAAIERALNLLEPPGDPSGWADELARIATACGVTTIIVGVQAEAQIDGIRRLGEEIAPRARELVA